MKYNTLLPGFRFWGTSYSEFSAYSWFVLAVFGDGADITLVFDSPFVSSSGVTRTWGDAPTIAMNFAFLCDNAHLIWVDKRTFFRLQFKSCLITVLRYSLSDIYLNISKWKRREAKVKLRPAETGHDIRSLRSVGKWFLRHPSLPVNTRGVVGWHRP